MKTRIMTELEIDSYKNELINGYLFELINSGCSNEDALNQLNEDFDSLIKLPGKILIVQDEDNNYIGRIWFCIREFMNQSMGYITEMKIFESYRKKGFGKELTRYIETEVKNMGINKIGLNVNKNYESVVNLYKGEGYKIKYEDEVNMIMVKEF